MQDSPDNRGKSVYFAGILRNLFRSDAKFWIHSAWLARIDDGSFSIAPEAENGPAEERALDGVLDVAAERALLEGLLDVAEARDHLALEGAGVDGALELWEHLFQLND